RGCGPQRLCPRPSDCAAEKDRAPSPLRIDGANPPSPRRLLEGHWQEGRRVFVHESATAPPKHDQTTVCTSRFQVDCRRRTGPEHLWHPLAPTHQGDLDLPSHRKPASGSALARPHPNRKYGEISWHRSRRCTCNIGTG